jgi:flagellar protein FliS
MNTAYDQYKKNTVYTSTPEELTLMVYNGLIKFIMRGISAIESREFEKANNSIIRAQAIISELQSSLDKKYEISHSLGLLYDYMKRRLVDANVKKDIEILNEVLGFAKELRDTWNEALRIAKRESRGKAVATNM